MHTHNLKKDFKCVSRRVQPQINEMECDVMNEQQLNICMRIFKWKLNGPPSIDVDIFISFFILYEQTDFYVRSNLNAIANRLDATVIINKSIFTKA